MVVPTMSLKARIANMEPGDEVFTDDHAIEVVRVMVTRARKDWPDRLYRTHKGVGKQCFIWRIA